MENVGIAGDLPKGCEGADVVEVGRGRRELRKPPKVISYTSNKAEQTRGQKETAVQMEPDYVSGSEMYEEEKRDDVDGVRRDRRCYNCGMMGHFAKIAGREQRAKEKERTNARDMAKARARR